MRMRNVPMNSLLLKLRKINRARNFKTKKVKLWLRMIAKDCYLRKRTVLDKASIKKILIIMPGKGIGDALVMTGLVNALAENGFKVSVLAESRITHIFEGLECVNHIHTLQRSNQDIYTFRKIAQEKYDLLIDIDEIDGLSPLRLNMIKKCRPAHTLGINQFSRLYDTSISYRCTDKHITARHTAVAAQLNVNLPAYEYLINIPEAVMSETKGFIDRHKGVPVIILNPYGTEEIRGMSLEQINQFCTLCMKHFGTKPFITAVADRLYHIPDWGNHIKFSLATFQHVAAAIKLSDIVVSTDTSVVHLSRALDKKLVCLYNNKILPTGDNNNVLWGPNYPKATQITSPGRRVDQIKPELIFRHALAGLKGELPENQEAFSSDLVASSASTAHC